MTDEDRDRLIAAAEELKVQRRRETCVRAVVCLEGKEWAPGRCMRDRYFIVSIPKDRLGDGDRWNDADRYVNHRTRFPLLMEMALNSKYGSARVVHFIGDEELEEVGG